MLIEDIQNICKKFPHVTEDVKWETHLCYCVGEKMFIITSPDTIPVNASFKVDEEDFAELTEKEGFIPAPYLARYKWIHVDNISRLSNKQWDEYLKKAYELVKAKLPAKKKKELGIT
jgi:predicted DNA-binding protein (MmcQ/YjbR family)